MFLNSDLAQSKHFIWNKNYEIYIRVLAKQFIIPRIYPGPNFNLPVGKN